MTGNTDQPDDLRVGRVLGGGEESETEMPFQLDLKENPQSVRSSEMLEKGREPTRFPQTRGVDPKRLGDCQNGPVHRAEVPKIYHRTRTRFFRVVRLLPNGRHSRTSGAANGGVEPTTARPDQGQASGAEDLRESGYGG